MPFIAYFIVLVFAAGAALFGLDVLTAPLPPQGMHAHVAGTATNKLAERETDRNQRNQGGKPGTLTPLYPAQPGEKNVRAVDPANPATRAETTGVAPAQMQAPAPSLSAKQTVAVQPSPLQADQTANDPQLRSLLQPTVKAVQTFSDAETKKGGQAKAEPAAPAARTANAAPAPSANAVAAPSANTANATATPSANANEQATAQSTGGHCDLQACARAYHSFRASDCTYQPYDGPRRICAAPAAQSIAASRPADRQDDIRPAAQRAREVTRRYGNDDRYDNDNRDYDDDVDDDAADVPMQGDPGSVVIIRRPRW